MNIAKFYIKKRVNEEFYFILNSANNQTILVSEGYSNRQNCQKGIDSVKQNSTEEERFERKRSSSIDQYYFVLKAANHETIGVSEMFNSAAAMENGIEAVKRDAAGAPVVDAT